MKRSPKQPQPIRDEIFIRLLVLDRKDLGSSLDQVARQEHVYREHLTHLTAYRRTCEPIKTEERMLNSLAADAALFHAEAHLKWLEHCRSMLQSWEPDRLELESGAEIPPMASPKLPLTKTPSVRSRTRK